MWRLRARDERYAWRDAKMREGRSFASKSILSWIRRGVDITYPNLSDLFVADANANAIEGQYNLHDRGIKLALRCGARMGELS